MPLTHQTDDDLAQQRPHDAPAPAMGAARGVPQAISPSAVLALQRCAGNAATARMLSRVPRCSCGGIVAAGGECARCRARREAAEQDGGGRLARSATDDAEPARCHYEPGERQRSAASEGAVDQDVGADSVTGVLFDFTPGSAQVKSNHHAFIRDQIAQTGLQDPNTDLEIAVFTGFTDCVDSEGKNVSIRARRAEAVKAAYLDAGAAPELLGPHEAAATGPAPGHDGDPEGRMHNRAVTFVLRRRPITPDTPPKGDPPPGRCPECDASTDVLSGSWALESVGGAGLVPGAGAVTLDFNLRNRRSDCVYRASFSGTAFGGSAGISYDLTASEEKFASAGELRPDQWTGKADARSVSVGVVEFGSIRLPNFDTQPARLGIGGLLNVGKDIGPAGAWFADGTFTVEPCGHTGPQTEFATTTTRLDPPDWVV